MREKELRAFLTEVIEIKDERIVNELLEKMAIKTISAKKTFYHAGETSNTLMILMNGVFATFYNRDVKREIMECLCFNPGEAAIDFSNLQEHPAFSSDFKTITDCTFATIPYQFLEKIAPQSQEIMNFIGSQMAWSAEYHMLLRRLGAMEPHKRVKAIHEYYGDALSHLTHKEIAQFLNMSRSNYEKCLSDIYRSGNKTI